MIKKFVKSCLKAALFISLYPLILFIIVKATDYSILFDIKKHKMVMPVIMNIRGYSMSQEEKIIFKKINPFGFILHGNSFKTKEQVIELIDSIRALFPDRKVYFFTDQEGGEADRLERIGSPKSPSAKYYGEIARDNMVEAKTQLYNHVSATSGFLREIGMDVNLAPVLDIFYEENGKPASIGSRSYSHDIDIVTELGKVFTKASHDNGLHTTIKHIPGLSNSLLDTHEDKVVIDTKLEILEKTDFMPFKSLSKSTKFAMVNHVIYSDIDDKPASISAKTIDIIRKKIGFDGLIISDAFNMKAISDYDVSSIVQMSFNAGVDIVMPNIISIRISKKVIDEIDEEIVLRFNKKIKALGL